MTVQTSVALRNAALDARETATGTAPKLQIRTGAQPASCATADSGTLLAELDLPSDWMAAASSGTKAKAGTWSGTASAAGDAAHFRIKDSSGTTCHWQGSVTATGGGGDMTMSVGGSPSVTLGVGYTFTVDTFTLTEAGA
jgi:hypothetical protein